MAELDPRTGIMIVPERDALLTPFARSLLEKYYARPGETPQLAYARAARAWCGGDMQLAQRLYNAVSQGWFMFASPVLSNAPLPGEKAKSMPISCLTGDAPINTRTGMKRMRDVDVGDLLLTHRGRWRPVVAKTSRMSSGDLYEMTLASRTTNVRITGNHPVLTNMGWVRVDELDADRHLVAVNGSVEVIERPYTLVSLPPQTLPAGKGGNTRFERAALPERIEVDEDLAWALGLWFAEGSHMFNAKRQPNGLRITVGSHERHLAERWLEIMSEKFGVNGGIYESERVNVRDGDKNDSWLTTYVSSSELGDMFAREFGVGCKTKEIPSWLHDLPKSHLKSFLDAFVEGDGCEVGKSAVITISNMTLIGGLYNIALKLGHGVSLRCGTNGTLRGEKTWVYTLRIGAWNGSLDKNRILSGVPFHDGLVYCPIRSLERLDQDEEVFDIQVAEDESFSVAGWVVHNCFLTYVDDSIQGLNDHTVETRWLAVLGGGVGGHWSAVRAVSEKAPGPIPFMHCMDADMEAFKQGTTRKGSYAAYLDVSHPDILEFLHVRVPTGDASRKCLGTGFHNAINITDAFMDAVERDGAWALIDPHSNEVRETMRARDLWEQILEVRYRTGEPYLHFIDASNRALPASQKALGLRINGSNLCSEITLATSVERTAVCCLSSLNAELYDEWYETDLVGDLIEMLDNVLQFFIDHAPPALARAVYSARMERSLGLGLMGFHAYLQRWGVPFESERAREVNRTMFKIIHEQAIARSEALARLKGEAPDMVGTGRRNAHLISIAPNANSSILLATSPSIEVAKANAYKHQTRAGTWPVKNRYLEAVLTKYGRNDDDTWKDIILSKGSVQHLDFLSDHEKAVFKTAIEIDQSWVVRHAADRQPFICQAQSVNLFFPPRASRAYFNAVHRMAWREGLKSLYYVRSETPNRAENVSEKIQRVALRDAESVSTEEKECVSCHG